jgi:hypothetical protein
MTINQESGLIYPSYFSILTCCHPNQILYMGISTNEICIKSLQLQNNTQNDYCFIKKTFFTYCNTRKNYKCLLLYLLQSKPIC